MHDLQPPLPGLEPPGRDTVHDEVPAGLIDLPSAARKYGVPLGRIQGWVDKGTLNTYGRVKAPARGGGYRLVSERELEEKVHQPLSKGGRPRTRG